MHLNINGYPHHIATINSDTLRSIRATLDKHSREYKAIQKELGRRLEAKDPVYRPVVWAEVKDADGVTRKVAVGGYQSFSGGSRQTTERQKDKAIPPEWT